MLVDIKPSSTLSSITNNVNNIEEVSLSHISSKNIRGRDVVIINPYCDGGGDEALAKKNANIVLDEGCRVTINSFDARNKKDNSPGNYKSYSLQHDQPHSVSQLNNPLFIITPVSIVSIEHLNIHLGNICEKYGFPKKDVILIEEMDILLSKCRMAKHYESMLREIGFTNITNNHLGFSEGAIGYIPTDEKTINEINNRFENELCKLIDSYNMSLARDSSYHLGYISSDCYISGTQAFIVNTLSETVADERSANFIMSLRLLEPRTKQIIVNQITDILMLKNEQYDYRSLFSKASIIVINSDSGNIEEYKKITGEGTKEIKIILTDKIPKNIYDDFLLLAETGMTSGDQSLSEYLTLKGKLPYYDMQPWKYPLVKSLKNLGGDELKTYLEQKVTGRMPFSREIVSSLMKKDNLPILTPEQLIKKNDLDKKISSKIATPYIKELIRAAG